MIFSNGSRLSVPRILELLTSWRPYRLTLSVYAATAKSSGRGGGRQSATDTSAPIAWHLQQTAPDAPVSGEAAPPDQV
jgi:hypothetical protein